MVFRAALSLLLSCAVARRSAAADSVAAAAPVAQTSVGRFVGVAVAQDGLEAEAFLGIRYARAPVGDLRFARALPPAATDAATVVDASAFGAPCMQFPLNTSRRVGRCFPQTPVRWVASWILQRAAGVKCATHARSDMDYPNPSEDCLFLNVWRPKGLARGARAPVLFWIHGGGLDTGTGAQGWFRGTALAKKFGVVVVTINYRLSALGFLPLDAALRAAVAARSGAPPVGTGGANGLHDQARVSCDARRVRIASLHDSEKELPRLAARPACRAALGARARRRVRR